MTQGSVAWQIWQVTQVLRSRLSFLRPPILKDLQEEEENEGGVETWRRVDRGSMPGTAFQPQPGWPHKSGWRSSKQVFGILSVPDIMVTPPHCLAKAWLTQWALLAPIDHLSQYGFFILVTRLTF